MHSHLIKIEDWNTEEITSLINTAKSFKAGAKTPDLKDKTVCLMFFENSTRTKISFEMAAKNLNMKVIHFDNATSSINKGETLKETIENLYFIGINGTIIRTSDDNLINKLREELSYPMHLLNAGSGKSSHPTQALLDYFTMLEKLGNVKNKKITIVGDIEHSRVAKSNIALLKKFGAKLTVCAPEFFKPEALQVGVNFVSELAEAIHDADAVMGLRIQKERIKEVFSEEEYVKNYRLNTELLERCAPNAILMHPGPVNRDIEMTSELIDGIKGRTILEQARNGVFVRMALLNLILGEDK